MIAEGLMPDAKQIVVLASAYRWQLNSDLVPCSIDDEGNTVSLLAPNAGKVDTPQTLFSQPRNNAAIIGLSLRTPNLVAYESKAGTPHAFPNAFVEPTTRILVPRS